MLVLKKRIHTDGRHDRYINSSHLSERTRFYPNYKLICATRGVRVEVTEKDSFLGVIR